MKINEVNMLGLKTTSLGGYSASEVGRALSINRENASRGAARGKKVLLCRETIFSDIMQGYFLDDEH
jgi:hypothetical protein